MLSQSEDHISKGKDETEKLFQVKKLFDPVMFEYIEML